MGLAIVCGLPSTDDKTSGHSPPLTPRQLAGRIADIERKQASAAAALKASTAAYKECRKAGGAAAHKRSWYFEEKMIRYEAEIAELQREADALGLERDRHLSRVAAPIKDSRSVPASTRKTKSPG
jgi:hypothetical protein